ncbi:MAG: Dabb family protein [Cyclobacteriaceae bacterium]
MKMSPSKLLLLSFTIFSCFILGCTSKTQQTESTTPRIAEASLEEAGQLRHVVLFKFKEDADPAAIKKVEESFAALPGKIPEIKDFEWGTNNSPEGHDKGFTHCFILTFESEEGRATYLPHPDHKAFGALLGDILEDVTVVDYWVK